MPDPFQQKPLTDDDLYPWGMHKGVKLKKVPAQYLLYMWDECWHSKPGRMYNYIKENFSSLEQDALDYIVQHKPKP